MLNLKQNFMVQCMCLLYITAPIYIYADEVLEKDFKERIKIVFQSTDRKSGIFELFYLENMDELMIKTYDRTVSRLSRMNLSGISFTELPDNFDPVYILDGYEYRPNLKPIGYVVLSGNEMGGETKVIYGERNGKYYFTGVTKKLVNPDTEPDKTLQIIVIGVSNPPLKFSGYCDIKLSNNKLKRMDIDDSGNGNQTIILKGQKIDKCEVKNLSDNGTLSLRLLEGENTIYEQRIEVPEKLIVFN